jgi:predicted RecB family nuclease
LTGRLETLLEKPEIKKWFDGSMHVMNEAEILFDHGKSGRPDRVMMGDGRVFIVDYKFGEQKNERHRQQLKKYRQLIRDMGYGQVNSYLWYVELNEIEEVDAGKTA